MRKINSAILLCILLSASTLGQAPAQSLPTFNSWLLDKLAAAKAAALTQTDPGKQTDAPAISQSSASLVDHTSTADFLTGALNLAGVGGSTNTGTAGTVSVSAFALLSSIQGENPLRPEYYNAHPDWRRWAFSFGTDSSGAAASSATTTTSASSGRIVGITYLLLNKRDLTQNKDKKKDIGSALGRGGISYSRLFDEIQRAIFARYGKPTGDLKTDAPLVASMFNELWPDTMTKLTADKAGTAQIDQIVAGYVADFQAVDNTITEIVNDIRHKPQLSISGLARFGEGRTINDYRAQIAYDQGLTNKWNLTLNGSFDYFNSPLIGADTRAGRGAADFQYVFSGPAHPLTGKNPVSLDFSAEGDWIQSMSPTYVGQLKLTIPIVNGLDFPLSVSYGSQSTLLHEAHVVGKFGLTFDLSRLAKAFVR